MLWQRALRHDVTDPVASTFGARVRDVSPSQFGWTAMMHGAKSGQEEVCFALLDADADANSKSTKRVRPVACASRVRSSGNTARAATTD